MESVKKEEIVVVQRQNLSDYPKYLYEHNAQNLDCSDSMDQSQLSRNFEKQEKEPISPQKRKISKFAQSDVKFFVSQNKYSDDNGVFDDPSRQNLNNYPKYFYDQKQNDGDFSNSQDDSQMENQMEKASPILARHKSSFAINHQKSVFAIEEKINLEEENKSNVEVEQVTNNESQNIEIKNKKKTACCSIF